MRYSRILLLFIAFITIFTFSSGAQDLPSLPKSPDVVTGSLPNGIDYYLVRNSVSSGFADFALVQKGAVSEELSRRSLTSLHHFQDVRPYQYLAKLGVGYKKNGYIHTDGYSTTFHFEEVPVSQQSVRDTVLLMLFDICETSPYNQAIVVSGDLDPNVVKQRMDVFSMMVTPRQAAPKLDDSPWEPTEQRKVRFVQAPPQDEAVLSFTWESARTPRAAMNTVQPLVSQLYANLLGCILKERALRVLERMDIPVGSADFEYRSSADSPGPELYTFNVSVAQDKLESAVGILAGMMAELKENGASETEFANAKQELLARIREQEVFSNAQWVRKCTSAFLYGSDLASPKSVAGFFLARNVAQDRETALFNDFISILMDPDKGLNIRYEAPGEARAQLSEVFESGWKEGLPKPAAVEYAVNLKDTVSLVVPKTKAKLKVTSPEPVTGGEMWTWSNGMKVIFKKAGDDRRFSYGFLINGGLAEVPGLKQGEGGFIGDMLSLDDVAGFSAEGFRNMLRINGVSLTTDVTVSHLALQGSAPSSKVELLLKSLVAIANSRHTVPGSYEYYRECEKLRISAERRQPQGIQAVVDSIMSPDFRFTESRQESGLSDDLQDRAQTYFDKRFNNCHDGALVIVGDVDPFVLKKLLTKYIGAFHTAQGSVARPQSSYALRSGWSTYTVDAEESSLGNGEPCVNVSASALMPFTADKYMAFKVASVELKRRVAEALAETGMYAEVEDHFELYPAERLSLSISCHPADEWGLPSDMVVEDPLRVLGAVRNAMAELSSAEVSAEFLKSAKSALISKMSADQSRPELLVDAAMMRYSAGKDLVSGYKEKINAVSAAKVKEILSALSDGSKVEFVIY